MQSEEIAAIESQTARPCWMAKARTSASAFSDYPDQPPEPSIRHARVDATLRRLDNRSPHRHTVGPCESGGLVVPNGLVDLRAMGFVIIPSSFQVCFRQARDAPQ